jgi:transcriptional regulator with XRE-family HTH domain
VAWKANGEAIRALRERSGYSTSGLAAELGIGHSHLSNIEAGRRQPSPALLKEMAGALKVPVVALLGPENPEQVA